MAGQTKVIVATSGNTFTLPGTHWNATQVAQAFSENVPGITGMSVEQTTENGDNVFTFRPRTGTKG
jgi:hypothetical protein